MKDNELNDTIHLVEAKWETRTKPTGRWVIILPSIFGTVLLHEIHNCSLRLGGITAFPRLEEKDCITTRAHNRGNSARQKQASAWPAPVLCNSRCILKRAGRNTWLDYCLRHSISCVRPREPPPTVMPHGWFSGKMPPNLILCGCLEVEYSLLAKLLRSLK